MAYDTLQKRNWRIYFEWIEGKEYNQLAEEFKLSETTIKEICTAKIPDKVKHTPWQTANSYKKYREWKRKQLREYHGNKQTNATSNTTD